MEEERIKIKGEENGKKVFLSSKLELTHCESPRFSSFILKKVHCIVHPILSLSLFHKN